MQFTQGGSNDLTTDGSSQEVPWSGGVGVMSVTGTFDGATVTIHHSPDNGTTFIPTTAALTAAGHASFTLPAGIIKAVISNDGAGTSLNAWVGYAQHK